MNNGHLKQFGFHDREAARAAFLDALCREIERDIAAGVPAGDAINRASRRRCKRLFTHGCLSRQRITVLFYAWRKSPGATIFVRRYKPGKPRIPAALVHEFLNRLAGDRVVPAATAMRSLRADWQMGLSIPGLGTWREYLRRTRGENAERVTPPRFPFSDRTLVRYLAPKRPDAYARRVGAAIRAQRDLARFFEFVEARRLEADARSAHEPLAAAPRQLAP